jgi:CHAT domain-containing protein
MKRFYANLKAGRSKDDALRLAQIDLIRSVEFAEPRDWAAFQLNGDWK